MAPPTTRLTIVLDLTGDAATAVDVVNNVLDDGVLQDAINDYAADDGPVHVLSAVVHYGSHDAGDSICGYCGKAIESGRCRECRREGV